MEAFIELIFTHDLSEDILYAALLDFDIQGVVEDDDGWKVFFTKSTWVSSETDIRKALSDFSGGIEFAVRQVEQQNWNEVWEQSITPVKITDNLVIAPSWSDYEPGENELVLIVDPKMSFGTGFHETTRLMLRLLQRWVKAGDRVLDIGTGTGVLAIASVKWGAAHAVGVDIDEWAESNAGENIKRNGVQGHVDIFEGSIERADGNFDLILSNITRNDNIELLDAMMSKLNPGGRLVLSGFYSKDEVMMTQACSDRKFQKVAEEIEADWIATSYTRNI
jgi:ribosomal protein L11 methyltransferase